MSDDSDFRCPVCRARQPLRETCRRCEADLHLVVRAHRRLVYLKSQLAQTHANGEKERERQIITELRWLVPSYGQANVNTPPPSAAISAGAGRGLRGWW